MSLDNSTQRDGKYLFFNKKESEKPTGSPLSNYSILTVVCGRQRGSWVAPISASSTERAH